MISVDGFDDPPHDAGEHDHTHDGLVDLDTLDHHQAGFDSDPIGTGTAVGEATNGDDSSGTTAPTGGDLTAAGPAGEQIDLGPADVSSAGDPDHLDSTTAVSADGSSIGVYTDLDGDGTVDQIIDVRADGSYTLYLQDQAGDWHVGQTGHISADGQVIADETPAADPGHAQPAVFADGVAEPGGDTHPAPGGEPTVSVPEGAHVDGAGYTGHAEQDATGDGTNDTVVLHGADGSVTTATDYDGDGVADQVTVVAPDGTVTVSATDADGAWHTVATGAVTPDGGIVFHDPVAQPGGSAHAGESAESSGEALSEVPDGHIAVQSGDGWVDGGAPTYDLDHDGTTETAVYHDGAALVQVSDSDGDGRADHMLRVEADRTATLAVDSGDGWQTTEHGRIDDNGDFVPDPDGQNAGPVEQQDEPSGDLVLTGADGTRHDLGGPDQDLDGDGVPESVAARTQDGHLLIVSDTDGDGTPDQLIEIDPESGHVVWAQPDAGGNWVQVHTGHVDPDGNLVVDQAAQPVQDEAGDRVAVAVDGGSFDAGRATIDADGDGVPDTVAVDGPQGSTLYYQDADGDGVADRAWTSDSTGRVVAEYTLDAGSGTWTATRS